ncbi:MAG: DUF938 domain-containing protein [Burkholderiaceae bacterium]|nr:DUF938 domain-containing protein [Burkholderiaceae bacterium]
MNSHRSSQPNVRLHSPAAERNQAQILAELRRVLPRKGLALEIASGTGQHAAHFAVGLHGWHWQPTDAEPQALASIDAWCGGLTNVRPALHLDVLAAARDASQGNMPAPFDAIYCANMLHISPWDTCAALMRLAAQHLTASGVLLLYGPYLEDTVPTAPSNLAFDADLRARDAAWGLRRLADVLQQAQAVGLQIRERVPMPANNLLLVLERAAPSVEKAT